MIDEEVRRITTEGYNKAHEIIEEYKDKHDAIAKALLEYETLDEKQILSLFETGKMPESTKVQNDTVTPMSYEEAKQAANNKLVDDEDASETAVKPEVLEPRNTDED